MTADTIIFDLDGTLVDTAGDLTASLNHALGTLGRPPIDPPAVRAMVGHGARKLLERGLAATGELTPGLVEAGVAPFLQHYAAHIAVHSRPFDGVEQALSTLEADGLRLAVCTNKPVALAEALVAELGWAGRFRALLGADSRPWKKPDPRHLTDTLAAAQGRSAIFVGDSRTDADTARAAGVPLVLVSFGYSTDPVETLGADALIHHFDALIPAIAKLRSDITSDAACNIQGQFTRPSAEEGA
jgi:phosphoglycolate phosphatase